MPEQRLLSYHLVAAAEAEVQHQPSSSAVQQEIMEEIMVTLHQVFQALQLIIF